MMCQIPDTNPQFFGVEYLNFIRNMILVVGKIFFLSFFIMNELFPLKTFLHEEFCFTSDMYFYKGWTKKRIDLTSIFIH